MSDPKPHYRIAQLLPAPAGWFVIYACMDEHDPNKYSPDLEAVALWALCEGDEGQFVFGVTVEQFDENGMFRPDMDPSKANNFVGYMAPGQSVANHQAKFDLVASTLELEEKQASKPVKPAK